MQKRADELKKGDVILGKGRGGAIARWPVVSVVIEGGDVVVEFFLNKIRYNAAELVEVA